MNLKTPPSIITRSRQGERKREKERKRKKERERERKRERKRQKNGIRSDKKTLPIQFQSFVTAFATDCNAKKKGCFLKYTDFWGKTTQKNIVYSSFSLSLILSMTNEASQYGTPERK